LRGLSVVRRIFKSKLGEEGRMLSAILRQIGEGEYDNDSHRSFRDY
jgi:hypothetical protein